MKPLSEWLCRLQKRSVESEHPDSGAEAGLGEQNPLVRAEALSRELEAARAKNEALRAQLADVTRGRRHTEIELRRARRAIEVLRLI